MNFKEMGSELRRLRKEQGITQSRLCKGICTQPELSKIEKGDVHPYLSTYFQLTKRLNADMIELIRTGFYPRYDYITEVVKNTREEVANRNYIEIRQIVKAEKKGPLYRDVEEYRQFIRWHEALCINFLDGDLEGAIGALDDALAVTAETRIFYSRQEIEILNSKGNLYYLGGQLEEAKKTFLEAFEAIDKIHNLRDPKIRIRLLYNNSIMAYDLEDYNGSYDYCTEAITLCKTHGQLYLLGELYFQLGLNEWQMGMHKTAKETLNLALCIFKITEDDYYIRDITETFKQIEEGLEPVGIGKD